MSAPISVQVKEIEKHEKQSKVPAEVFLGRRGSFPVAPGLEHFSTTNESLHVQSDADDGEGNVAITSSVIGAGAKIADLDLSKYPGLVRRFGVNVRLHLVIFFDNM